ncbi:hypothetical protein GF337_18690 [candidate division KSB1 bacterium]|nr:hypothetical protein [candidate division KSB1 bacterium]
MGFWEDFTAMFKKGVSVVAKKTDEYTKIGKIKVDIIAIKREIDKNFTQLGSKVYQLVVEENTTKIASDDEVKVISNSIKELNEKLDAKKQELEAVRQEYAEKTGQPIEDVDVEEVPEEEPKG